MHIVIITTEYTVYNNVGGIATFTSSLAHLLVQHGHTVFVLTNAPQINQQKGTFNPITVVPFVKLTDILFLKKIRFSRTGQLIVSFLKKFFPETSRLLWINIVSLITLLSLQRRENVQIIHTPVLFAPGGLASFLYPKIPLVTHAQGPDELLQQYDSITFDTKLKARIETCFMKRSSMVITCSQSVHNYLKNKYQSIRHKLRHIPNFIDTNMFPSPSVVPNLNRILFLGRMEYRKGPDLLVKAFIELAQQNPHLTLTYIGEDTFGWSLNGRSVRFSQYIRSFRLPISIQQRISFISRIDQRSKLINYLTSHRGIAILPSRYEPFGFVFVEAMAAGCVTVASAEGGGSEIIQNGIDGFTIKPTIEDIIMSVKKIHTLNQQQLINIIRHAKNTICDKYDMSSVENSYKSLYKQIMTPSSVT